MKIKLLKDRNFLLLMMGKLVSLVGTRAQSFALSLYVLNITGSATKFASVLAITFIPSILLGPIAGVFVDWLDRKKIIVLLDFLRGITIAVFAGIFILKGSLSMIEIYALVIITSMASLAFQPAITTVIPSIVEKDDLMEANSIDTIIMNAGNLISPAIAGVIFGVYGLVAILIMNSISFILSGISEIFISIPKTNKKPQKIGFEAFRRDFIEGIDYIRGKKIILNLMVIGMFANFLIQPMGGIGRAFIAKEVFGFSNTQYGLIESILITSMFIAPIAATWLSKKMDFGKIFKLDLMLVPIYGIALAVITTEFFMERFSGGPVTYIVFAITGFLTMFTTTVGNICLMTLFQREIDLKVMGRVNTTMATIAMAITPIGQMLFGKLFDSIDPWIVIASGMIPMFFIALIMGKNLSVVNEEEIDVDKEKVCS